MVTVDHGCACPGVEVELHARFFNHLIEDALEHLRVDDDAHTHASVDDEIVVVLQLFDDLRIGRPHEPSLRVAGSALCGDPTHHLVTDAGDLLLLGAGTHVGDEDDEAPRGHAAQVVVALDQGCIGSVPGRRQRGGHSGRPAPDDQHLGLPTDLQPPRGLQDRLFH